MQHTEKYKLNLIEPSDPFLPDGLNANTQKIEDAMEAHREEVRQDLAEVAGRVTTLEAKKFAYGAYQGTGKDQTIHIGFAPLVVFVYELSTQYNAAGILAIESDNRYAVLLEDGFQPGPGVNVQQHPYCYIAFG